MEITQEEIDSLYLKTKKNAEDYGYHLNPDEQFTKDLIKGLLINEKRYGYQSCPCRLSEGKIEKDRDIICPCDYRDSDLNDYEACYCGLYVSSDILNGIKKLTSIPERRNLKILSDQPKSIGSSVADTETTGASIINPYIISTNLPVWRCRVCGYLCARENPPGVCPICKVKKDRFERFL